MSDIFDEVEESLREDKAAAGWKKYGRYVIGGAAALVASVGGYEFYSWQKSERIEASAAAYSDALYALETEDTEGAKTQLAAIADGESGFASLATHVLGTLEFEDGAHDAAAKRFAAGGVESDPVFGELALLKSAYLQADTLDYASLETLVTPLLSDTGSMDALARELLAAKKLADGNFDDARRDYQALSLRIDSTQIPTAFRQRVQRTLLALNSRVDVTGDEATVDDAGAGEQETSSQ